MADGRWDGESGNFSAFAKLSAVKEETGNPDAKKKIGKAGDQATADLGTRRMDVLEKNAWMLRSYLA